VKIGAQYQGGEQGPKAFARRAEAAGFDSVWCGDHVGHLIDGIATLGCYAGATEQITIGLNLLVAPYRTAAVMAKALATIALVAPGRVVAGFGVGGEFPGEFTATGAQLNTRGAYTNEALDVITRLWTGQPVSYHGRWTQLDDFTLEPAPAPPPQIWIGGRSEAAMARALRFGTGYSPYLVSPQQFDRRRHRLVELAAETNQSLHNFTLACLVTVVPARSVDEALERGLASLKLSGVTPESVRAQYLLGDDDSILAGIQAYRDAGVDHLILGCLPGDDQQLDEYFSTCDRLLPTVRTPH
jgi:alkanesulfonate monooxygenase SsuD/methylene tetrahydromethanopterin reductase-like flavin-dependent oxidoreductase (luciferase family)